MKKTTITLGAAVLATTVSMQANALNILLTNDDGFDAPGINIMYGVLSAAGHNVTMVAPKENQSGKSMATNTGVGEPVEVVNFSENKWYVDGTPVDAVNAGLDFVLVDNQPDVVISGSNFGENVGSLANHSGTVGAALEALQGGIPGIAVSVALDLQGLQSGDPQAPMYTINAMDDAAVFTAQVLYQMTEKEGDFVAPSYCDWIPSLPMCTSEYEVGELRLPEGVGLNINYPHFEAAETSGVVVTNIGSWTAFDLTIAEGDNGAEVAIKSAGAPSAADQEADAYMLLNRFVTVSPMTGDLNARRSDLRQISRDLENAAP